MPDDVRTPAEVTEAAGRIARPRPLRRGSLSARFMKCGQPGCHCREDPQARHGPYYSLTRVTGGQTKSRYLSAEQAAVAQRQVRAAQEFRRELERYWEACERWADAELDVAQAASGEEAAKKGASKRPSRPRSSARSKRS